MCKSGFDMQSLFCRRLHYSLCLQFEKCSCLMHLSSGLKFCYLKCELQSQATFVVFVWMHYVYLPPSGTSYIIWCRNVCCHLNMAATHVWNILGYLTWGNAEDDGNAVFNWKAAWEEDKEASSCPSRHFRSRARWRYGSHKQQLKISRVYKWVYLAHLPPSIHMEKQQK